MRIISEPKWLPIPKVWEITVVMDVCSSKLAAGAYESLPQTIDHLGKTYTKSGMRADTCVAWYRRK